MLDCEIAIGEVLTQDQNCGLFSITIHDVTELRFLQRELKNINAELELRVRERTRELEYSRSFIAGVLDSTVDAILTVDDAGVIQSVNKTTTELICSDENKLLGMNIADFLEEPQRAEILQYLSGTRTYKE